MFKRFPKFPSLKGSTLSALRLQCFANKVEVELPVKDADVRMGDNISNDPASSLREFYKEEFEAASLAKSQQKQVIVKLKPTELSLKSITDVINGECDAEIAVYTSERTYLEKLTLAQIVLQLDSNRERVTLAESLIKQFRSLVKGAIGHEGLDTKDVDWVVIDLKVAMVHIFSPEARLEYAIDEKLRMETERMEEDSPDMILERYSKSLSRKTAGDPMRVDQNDFLGERRGENPFLR
jgi:ribosomal silencing factor RsfS